MHLLCCMSRFFMEAPEGCLVCPAPGLSGLCLQNQQGELCDGTRAGTQQVLITASFPPVDEIRRGKATLFRVSLEAFVST